MRKKVAKRISWKVPISHHTALVKIAEILEVSLTDLIHDISLFPTIPTVFHPDMPEYVTRLGLIIQGQDHDRSEYPPSVIRSLFKKGKEETTTIGTWYCGDSYNTIVSYCEAYSSTFLDVVRDAVSLYLYASGYVEAPQHPTPMSLHIDTIIVKGKDQKFRIHGVNPYALDYYKSISEFEPSNSNHHVFTEQEEPLLSSVFNLTNEEYLTANIG